MLIVPELETVFILVPRTGTGTLYREMRRVYPKAMLLYRHMEADGCPRGYDRWRRVGFVRHPLYRLFSLYNFQKDFGGGAHVQGGSASLDAERARSQVRGKTFEEWVLFNTDPWTVPYDVSGEDNYWPVLSRINSAPENKLSQFSYLRPDLGVTVLKFENLAKHMAEWGLNPSFRHNGTPKAAAPITPAISGHINRFCAWDLAQGCQPI